MDTCRLHKLDKGLTRPLLLLLLYDLLFGAQRIEGGGHYKRLLLQHKTPIQSTLARIYIKRQASSPQQLLPAALRPRLPHPRYVRINTLLCSLPQAIEALRADGWTEVDRPLRHPTATDLFVFPSSRCFYRDVDIDSLLVFPPSTSFHDSALYERGWVVLQDKASCMSAACLNPTLTDAVVDGCAAPGNKTSHLVAIIADKAKQQSNRSRGTATVDAFEVHQKRFTLLTQLLSQKGIDVHINGGTSSHPRHSAGVVVTAHHASFLSLTGDSGLGQRVTAVLLDPTCSGSGMTHTLDAYYKEKNREEDRKTQPAGQKHTAKKRKRTEPHGRQPKDKESKAQIVQSEVDEGSDEQDEQQSSGQSQSLSALSAFQTSLLTHAFTLPAVRHIVYSTCSHHTEENEAVIAASLAHSGRARGWEVEAGLLPHWRRRGRRSGVAGLSDAECERMVRCDADEDCMNGFFVCGLVRRAAGLTGQGAASGGALERKEPELAAAGDVRDGDASDGAAKAPAPAGDGESAATRNPETKGKRKKKKNRKKQKADAASPSP